MIPNAVMPASSRTAAPTSSRLLGGRRSVRRLGGRGLGEIERRVVREDALVQLVQLGAGLHADLLDERGARLAIRRERLRLPPGPVQREHPLRVQVLAQGIRCDERVELADHLGVPAGREVGVDRALGGAQPQRVEPADLSGGERLVGDVRERVAMPQGKRLARTRLVEQALEAHRVDGVARQLQLVAAAARDDQGAVAVERPPQVRDVELHHLRRAGRRLVAPQPLRETVRRHRPPRLEREHREHRPLLAGAQLDRARPRGEPRAAPTAARPPWSDPNAG